MKKAYVAGFIGKLAKMAAGVKQTHVKGGKVDMKFLSDLAKDVMQLEQLEKFWEQILPEMFRKSLWKIR